MKRLPSLRTPFHTERAQLGARWARPTPIQRAFRRAGIQRASGAPNPPSPPPLRPSIPMSRSTLPFAPPSLSPFVPSPASSLLQRPLESSGPSTPPSCPLPTAPHLCSSSSSVAKSLLPFLHCPLPTARCLLPQKEKPPVTSQPLAVLVFGERPGFNQPLHAAERFASAERLLP